PGGGRASSAKVAGRDDIGEAPQRRGAVPVIERRQALPGEGRIRGCLVPAHAANGKIRLAVGIRSGRPGRGSRPSRRVAKLLDGSFPRQGAAAILECLAPVVAPTVSTLIDELHELAVRDLDSLDP